jgi:hypothetical protein
LIQKGVGIHRSIDRALGTLRPSDACRSLPDELVREAGHAVIDGLVVEELTTIFPISVLLSKSAWTVFN